MGKKPTFTADEARRAYYAEWRKNHQDAVKRHQRDFWARQAERQAQQQKVQEAKNSD